MRASRLLRILLILQNRGRQTSAQLAQELEVATRTILRDVDAMSEAGLPIIVFQGQRGGIELGFNYRTRLTGLTEREAEAMTIQLAATHRALDAMGLRGTFETARAKLFESLPDRTRAICEQTHQHFTIREATPEPADPYVMALAEAVRDKRIVTIQARSKHPKKVHPCALNYSTEGWTLSDAQDKENPIAQADWGDVNISKRTYA